MDEREGVDIMNNENQKSASEGLDLLLDATLAKYAAVEPRPGLEQRILANLRAEPGRHSSHVWWKWGLAAIAVIIVVAIALTFRTEKPSRPVTAQRGAAPAQSANNFPTQLTNREATNMPKPHAIRPGYKHPNRAELAAASAPAPKLDQFPSPQPLSEDEQILAGYIEQHPRHAALLAEAHMDSLRRDEEERLRIESKDQRNTQ